MERVEIICPTCRAAYLIHRQFLNKYAKCKQCAQSFLAAESDSVPENALAALEEAAGYTQWSGATAGVTPPPMVSIPAQPPAPAALKRSAAFDSFETFPRIRTRDSLNFDWLAPLILLSYLAMLVMMGIHFTAAAIPFFARPPGAIDSPGMVWLRLMLSCLCFFVIVGPASWGAILLAAKIGREEPGFSSYIRACSIAALPILMVLIIGMITPTRSAVIVSVIVILPLAFICLKLIFDFDWPWTVLAFVFGLVFVYPAHLVSAGVLKWTMDAVTGKIEPAARTASATTVQNLPPGFNSSPPPISRAESLRHQLERFDAEDFSNRSRESLEARLSSFRLDAESIRRNGGNDPNLTAVESKAGEDAVLEQLKTGSAWVKRAAAGLLADIGTEKSLDALTDAAKSNDSSLADAAKKSLQKLSPSQMDAVAIALMDLDAASSFKRANALKALASAKPDERRDEVAGKLESLLIDDKVFPSEYDDHASALGVWARKQTVSNLIPLLQDERGSMFKRHAAMKALGKIGDPAAAYPLARWLILDASNASAALIEMGAVAEDELIKLLREKNPIARREAARVLEQIGTNKSLAELHRATNDPRDMPAAVAAKQAMESVRARVKERTAATQP